MIFKNNWFFFLESPFTNRPTLCYYYEGLGWHERQLGNILNQLQEVTGSWGQGLGFLVKNLLLNVTILHSINLSLNLTVFPNKTI